MKDRKISLIPALLGLIVILLISTAAVAEVQKSSATEGASPLSLIKSTIDQIIETNVKMDGEKQQKERQAKLREIINPHFNFYEMSKRSLGAHWETCTEEERKEFTDVFSDLLARTYLGRIDTLKTNIVTFDSEKIQMPRAIVKTTVNHEGEVFPIDYKLVSDQGKWGVYDVVIENIGLVANYRNEFAGIIRKEKFSGLLSQLKRKVEKLEG